MELDSRPESKNVLVGVIQSNSTENLEENWLFLEEQIAILSQKGVSMVFTPENMLLFASNSEYQTLAEELDSGPIQQRLKDLARQHHIWLNIGSFPICSAADKLTTTSLMFNPQGELAAHYDKLHLFDVDVGDAHRRYRESDTYQAGHQVVVCDTPIGLTGLSVCYDVRFPSLYQAMRDKGASVMVVAAAFTQVTGDAHWKALLQARAIETQSWVIASAQCGTHSQSRQTHGHSMIIDPWGTIAASLTETAGHFVVSIDHQKTQEVRRTMPVAQHSRFQTHFKE
jgi:predicted amidohydrolase